MSELVSIEQISTEKQIAADIAANLIQAAKLKTHKLKIAGESLSLYERAEAEAVIAKHLQMLRHEETKRAAAQEAAREPTLKEIAAAVKEVGRDVSDVAELQEEIKRLIAANQAIFKALIEFKTDTADRLAGLKTITVNMRDEMASSSKKTGIPEKEEKKHWQIAVIGVAKSHHPALSSSVGDHISLKLIEANDFRAIHQLRDYAVVFAMRKQTDVRHVEQLKSIKAQIKFIDGGIEDAEYELKRFSMLALKGGMSSLDLLKALDELEKMRSKASA